MSTDHALSGDYGDQLSLSPHVPIAGDVYVHPGVRQWMVVLSVEQRKRQIVTYRSNGEEKEMPVDVFVSRYQLK